MAYGLVEGIVVPYQIVRRRAIDCCITKRSRKPNDLCEDCTEAVRAWRDQVRPREFDPHAFARVGVVWQRVYIPLDEKFFEVVTASSAHIHRLRCSNVLVIHFDRVFAGICIFIRCTRLSLIAVHGRAEAFHDGISHNGIGRRHKRRPANAALVVYLARTVGVRAREVEVCDAFSHFQGQRSQGITVVAGGVIVNINIHGDDVTYLRAKVADLSAIVKTGVGAFRVRDWYWCIAALVHDVEDRAHRLGVRSHESLRRVYEFNAASRRIILHVEHRICTNLTNGCQESR